LWIFEVIPLIPEVYYANILRAAFLPISFCQKNYKPKKNNLAQKDACKMLMKLASGVISSTFYNQIFCTKVLGAAFL
jgi:hypothetical protein